MSGFFITGTDTSVGKTLTAAAVTLALSATYWKPVQSGDSDVNQVRLLTGLADEHFAETLYSLKAALSPDQAAKAENIRMDFEKFQKPQQQPLVVEGAGGLLVPLNEKTLMLDLIEQSELPVIIVSRGTLGTINHTLMTIEILRKRNIAIKGVVFSGELNPDNQRAIETWGKVKTLFHLPYFPDVNRQTLHDWVQVHQSRLIEVLQ